MRRATISLGRRRDPLREVLTPLMAGRDPVKFAVLRQATGDKRVMNERIDRVVMNGQQVARPVSGVFEGIEGRFRKALKR